MSIETSCDETAVSIIEATGDQNAPAFTVLGNALYSQIELHKEFGGVFPAMARREHARTLVPLFVAALKEAGLYKERESTYTIPPNIESSIRMTMEKEPVMAEAFLALISKLEKPAIDAIAVTQGPGLEPALWVGITFAKALNTLWGISVIPTNHMEGHIVSVLTEGKNGLKSIQFPAIALLISGGHTELVCVKGWGEYEVVGSTRDDAVGEAFDKVARMLGLPYPGGPEISKLAHEERTAFPISRLPELIPQTIEESPYGAMITKLPRPMIHSADLDFSFSGIKTSVLYMIKKLPELTPDLKKAIAREFEDAVSEVLTGKTRRAVEQYGAETIIVGGGVSANTLICDSIKNLQKEFEGLEVRVPTRNLSTDNAVMIAIAGFMRILRGNEHSVDFRAKGTMGIKE
ncbi:MAG: tRNA (adenosine(37)-N6)-threonylcarbamoyltransferase complex transferase subunit TsaD [Candidatus Paceibacterota bacterium]